jgi:hypothetical protein
MFPELDAASHPLLPQETVARARAIFESYLQEQTAKDRDTSALRSSKNGAAPSATFPLLEAPTCELRSETVEVVLNDLGVVMSTNDVKDAIFALRQSASVAHDNAAVVTRRLREAEREVEGAVSNSASSEATSAATGASWRAKRNAGASGTDDLSLPFALFLDLLATTLSDCDQRREMRALWHEVDQDGDDMLGASDVAAALLAGQQEGVTAEQVAELLAELDYNNDGRVSYEDFLAAMNTN